MLKLQNKIVKILLELLIINRPKRAILKSRWTKLKLKKYADFALQNLNSHKNDENKDSKIIWQYWHQGKENAPELIKSCFKSVEKYHHDYDIKVLNFNNIKDYVDLPQKYYKMLELKQIPIAIFSDILRLNLLKKYGGCWIDSTIYLTSRLDEKILNSDFFVMKKDEKIDNNEDKMSCFFIKSTSNNMWLNLIKDSIDKYWLENNYLINYFMFEHLMTLLADNFPLEWDKIPYFSAQDAGILQKKFCDKFDLEEFERIKNITQIHKLSHKIIKKEYDNDSFYNYILNNI